VWVQMFADVTGLPVEVVAARELGALGCAMAGAIAAGIYRDYAHAAQHMVKIRRRVEPNPARREVYLKKYARYQKLLIALATVKS